MWHDRKKRYRFQLYYCKEDPHYHLITGPENISWPAWSFPSLFSLIRFEDDKNKEEFAERKISKEDLEFCSQELEDIKKEIYSLAAIRKAGGDSEFCIPREELLQEIHIGIFWTEFQLGKISYMYYLYLHDSGAYAMPLYCDFLQRKMPKPENPTKKDWAELAKERVRLKGIEELGIRLIPG